MVDRMNLLDNELMHKYFGCNEQSCPKGHVLGWQECMAFRILVAMQEPMEMHEVGLFTADDGKTWEVGKITGVPFKEGEYHPTWLRLPDKWQVKPDVVEEKIRLLLDYYVPPSTLNIQKILFESQLRDIVRLAREKP